MSTIKGQKPPNLPPGTGNVIAMSAGLINGQAVVGISIGRPKIEETEAGELVATAILTLEEAQRIGRDLLAAMEMAFAAEINRRGTTS